MANTQICFQSWNVINCSLLKKGFNVANWNMYWDLSNKFSEIIVYQSEYMYSENVVVCLTLVMKTKDARYNQAGGNREKYNKGLECNLFATIVWQFLRICLWK